MAYPADPIQTRGTFNPTHVSRDYLTRTIATVRNHVDAESCWPQWANIFADELERLWRIEDAAKLFVGAPDEGTLFVVLVDALASAQKLRESGARYVNGKWEPQCPFGDMCSRCDAIGYCERMA